MADVRPPSNSAQAIAATALRAEQARMRIIAENIANANSTSRTPGGDPYRRQVPVFEPVKTDAGQGVKMVRVTPDRSDFKLEYDPGHPSADEEGYVKLPNVNTLIESLDMRAAQRAYEANLTVIETARAMELRALDIIRR
ncbi:flagellar basal body rod protein FlgC [Phenylobacterium sp.]|uniref:flagellar basal body rod protein FlgC n=1 Tax=Phenylobacterium sp. TaxID=1871053 RepID=UPI0025EDADD7|nr:flagellar basal body rod protein FlgC [Phenylobacterium sp.]MCA6310312.1 flagellar basal body rod protein FlgC [Phenylobacterium sp.]MCA6324665.1 flagellar basal body rod protein FlgC [Phenylobacterium sp.]MCA6336629.1 flagellar basal body rod protein FlgC [Phenylobacterium sp.]MCA6340643.1 flagellar basal body rod protein FlgC [Phenylobacterium sp.]MCA6341801.1 flagellar basal body rod protein FlgC [Phenylobacterium sp.]